MHVLVLCEYGTVNGGEQSLLAVLDHCPADVSITVLAPRNGPLADALSRRSLAHIPFCIRDAAGNKAPAEQSRDALIKVVESLRPDIVHANSLSMGRLTGAAAPFLTLPCTAHLRDIVRLSAAAANQLNGNQRLITVSHAARDFHLAQGVCPSRTVTLYNGIDCHVWRPQPRPRLWRPLMQLPDDALLAATIGQVGLRKGLDVLVEAAIRLCKSAPELHYVIAGERTSAKAEAVEFEQALHARVRETGLADRFHWMGYHEDISNLLADVDLLIHPARQEPFGRVLLEAAASGVPIVATCVGGTGEMLVDAESAFLVPAGDAVALASAVTRIIENPSLRRELGTAARAVVLERFEIRDRAADVFALWRETVRSFLRTRSTDNR